jgi:glycosyltransferase involved in cell wall biosynthesis
MNSPLISCIIPAYNGEAYLSHAIDSILAQTYRPLEIIVVDDGSTDGTPAIATAYGPQLRYECQANAGPAAARNHGLQEARGEFVAFLDQDDVWHPQKLSRQLSRFEARPELETCVAHVSLWWVSALRPNEVRFQGHRLSRPVPGYVTGTLLARRATFDKVGCFNPALRYGDAADWFLRAAEKAVVQELLPDVLLQHRVHRNNLATTQAADSRDEFLNILKASLDRRRKTGEPSPA